MLVNTIVEITHQHRPTILARTEDGGVDVHYPLNCNVEALATKLGLPLTSFDKNKWGYFLRVPGPVNAGHTQSIDISALHIGDFIVLPGSPVSRVERIVADDQGWCVTTRNNRQAWYRPNDKVEILL